jgi:hypothetical protein
VKEDGIGRAIKRDHHEREELGERVGLGALAQTNMRETG